MLGLAIPYTWELVEFKDQRKAVNKGVYGSIIGLSSVGCLWCFVLGCKSD